MFTAPSPSGVGIMYVGLIHACGHSIKAQLLGPAPASLQITCDGCGKRLEFQWDGHEVRVFHESDETPQPLIVSGATLQPDTPKTPASSSRSP